MVPFADETGDLRFKSLTCHGLSQSSGIGKAPSQAPTILDTAVNCTTLSITVSGLEYVEKKKHFHAI